MLHKQGESKNVINIEQTDIEGALIVIFENSPYRDESFKVLTVEKDELGFTHVKLQQVVNETGIKDKMIYVHFNKLGEVVAVNGQYENKIINIQNGGTPAISENKSVETALKTFNYETLKNTPVAEKEIILIDRKAYDTFKVNVQYDTPQIGNWDV